MASGNGGRFRAVKVCGGTACRRGRVKDENSTAKETRYHVCNRMIRIGDLGAWIGRERP